MANHSLRDSIVYRRARLSAPSAGKLMEQFAVAPRHSVKRLIAQAGPFRANLRYRDAFRFTNAGGWNMSQQDAATLRNKLSAVVVPVKVAAIESIRRSLAGVKVVINPPLLPSHSIGLPDLVLDYVIEKITGPMTDSILDKVVAGDPSDYGRCGGMAFAALDFFLASRDVPLDTVKPSSGPLRAFIWQRLLDSLDLNIVRFLDWTVQLHVLPAISKVASAAIGSVAGSIGGPIGAAIGALVAGGKDILGVGGADVLASRTRDELAELKRKLDAYPAWPIGLIYGDEVVFWKQHQIIASSYRDLPNGRLELRIWDNNDPLPGSDVGETRWIIDAGGDAISVAGAGKDVKGIICDRYDPVAPPVL